MKIDLDGIVVIVGNYGSGKTEISINLAANRKREGLEVRIADLDLVNPYFRTREARVPLSEMGIDVVLPPKQYLKADLPILSPKIAGMIRQPSQLTLLDVGGNDVGATVLAINGFSWGGWVTGGKAEEMAADAVVAALVPICIEQSNRDPQLAKQIRRLKNAQSYMRRDMVMEVGWATMPGASEPNRQVATACVEKLATLF